jgi:GTP cyclohydrolase II
VSFVAETLLPTLKGKYRVRAYQDLSPLGLLERREILVIIYGDLQAAASSSSGLPLRVHDACFTSEVLGSLKCDCRQQLDWALEFIQHNALHAGLVIYLSQEGRGIGLANKIKAYSLQERGYDTVDANRLLGFADDLREYSCVPSILDDLQVRAVRLMTNNPRKTESLASLGVNVVGRIPVIMPSNEHSAAYVMTKRQRMGHHDA